LRAPRFANEKRACGARGYFLRTVWVSTVEVLLL
jgi:hypothetical protein